VIGATYGRGVTWFGGTVSHPDRAVEAIATQQHGVISRQQARDCGHTRQGIDRRVASGQYREVHRRTFVLGGAPTSWSRRLWAAQLWAGPGAAFSHRSAAALLELEGIGPGFVELTSLRQIKTQGVTVYRKRLHERDVREVRGLRITSPSRTLLDLGDVHRYRVVERALDDALHRGLVSLAELNGLLVTAGGRGVRGTAILRALVESREPSDARSQSTLERRLARVIRNSDLPQPVPQYEVFDQDGFVARPDFAYPEHRLAVEAEGYRFHRDRQAWASDLERRSRLARAGWRVLHFTWEDVHDRPEWVIEQIRRTLFLSARVASTGKQSSGGAG
jgi:very-short-patch-repair endonuclease